MFCMCTQNEFKVSERDITMKEFTKALKEKRVSLFMCVCVCV